MTDPNQPGTVDEVEAQDKEIDPTEYKLDRFADKLESEKALQPELKSVAAGEEHLFHFQQIAADKEKLIDLEQKEVEEVVAGLNDRPPAEAAGVDISALKAADPTFDDKGFIPIARESFNLIREARSLDSPVTASGLLSDDLKNQLQQVIDGDVASHRHHLLPGLWIKDAKITGGSVADGKLTVVVQFHLTSQEMDRDGDLKLIAGSDQWQEWDERWTFWRDPSVDTSASDEQRILSREEEGGWMFAHKGWIVTKIERLGAADPLDPSNL